MSLKIKFLKQIFPPLTLSIFLTALVSTTFIIYYHFSTITETKNAILSTELSDMKIFADSISTHFEENINIMIDNINGILDYSEKILQNETKIFENDFLINSFQIATNAINLSNLSGYDKVTKRNFEYSMWYLPGNANISSKITQNNFIFFSQMDLYIRNINQAHPNYNLIYGFFESDGLQYKYPSYENVGYINFISNDSCEYTKSGKTEFFDMRCRPYAKDIKKFMKSPDLTARIMISEPYIYLENNQIGITICGYSIENSTTKNFTLIAPELRKLNYAFCIDFELKDFVSPQDLFDLKELYYYILYKDKVFYHPKFLTMNNLSSLESITEYEFEVKDSNNNEEAAYFNHSVLMPIQKYYFSNKSEECCQFDNMSSYEYKKKGKEYLATVMPLSISRTGENEKFTGLLCVIVEPKNLIFDKFDQVAKINEDFILYQVVIFMIIMLILIIFALFLINETVKSIINPLSDLCEVVKNIANDDLDADVTKNYTPNSKEIDQLYQSFSKLKFIMKYANQEFLSGNDAQALINYANALNLYLELNQKEGVGITYNNMGNIHLKNERYDEAITCYRMAVKTIEEELNEIYKGNEYRQTFTVKKNTKSMDLESQESNKSLSSAFLPVSRRRKEKMSLKPSLTQCVSSEKLNQMNEMYSNRLFQLASTLYSQSMKDGKALNWEEIITIYKKIIEIDSKLKGNNARIIQCLIFLANSYLEIGDHIASLKYLKEAESSLSLYEKVERLMKFQNEYIESIKNDDHEESQNKLKAYKNLEVKFQGSADILKQKLMFHYGMFYKKIGKYKQACIMFTQSIEIGKFYDPMIRKKSLEVLSNLLASQNLLHKAPNITNILARMEDINHKDIIFLLDYSESMGKGARIQYAIRNFVKIFDKYIKDNDRIGFIRFNLNCEVVFALDYKRNNTLQLRKQIENSLYPAGKTSFYDALSKAIKQFNYGPEQQFREKRRKWIVSLTDGEDNASNSTLKHVKTSFKVSDINLIIVGMGLSKDLANDLKDLCKTTKDGAFIESPNNNDLDVAFESITQIIYGNNLIVETF